MVDVLSDEEWDTIGIDADGNLVPFEEHQIDRIVASLAMVRPPRLFTLCGVRRDECGRARDVAVIGWGMALGDDPEDDESPDSNETALCYLPSCHSDEKPTLGLFTSAERACRLFGRHGDVRVFWHT
jgi:hypothetical protein